MKTAWKMFITDTGLQSYQNDTLEQRDYYRMIVFLQNSFKGRIAEHRAAHRSFLYHLVRTLYGQEEEIKKNKGKQDDDNIRTFYIDGTPIYIGWGTCSGVSITAQNAEGNSKITEIADMIREHDIWWNN